MSKTFTKQDLRQLQDLSRAVARLTVYLRGVKPNDYGPDVPPVKFSTSADKMNLYLYIENHINAPLWELRRKFDL